MGNSTDLEIIELAEDINGVAILEGQRPKAVKVLWEAGKEYEEYKTERLRLGKLEEKAKKSLTFLYSQYPDLFVPTDETEKILVYSVAGLVIEIDKDETFTVKTKKENIPPISTAAENLAAIAPLKGEGRRKAAGTAEDPDKIF